MKRGGDTVRVHLTATEFALLRYFMGNPVVCCRNRRSFLLCGENDFDVDENCRDVRQLLRKKLDRLGPPVIHTVRLVGYALRPEGGLSDVAQTSSPPGVDGARGAGLTAAAWSIFDAVVVPAIAYRRTARCGRGERQACREGPACGHDRDRASLGNAAPESATAARPTAMRSSRWRGIPGSRHACRRLYPITCRRSTRVTLPRSVGRFTTDAAQPGGSPFRVLVTTTDDGGAVVVAASQQETMRTLQSARRGRADLGGLILVPLPVSGLLVDATGFALVRMEAAAENIAEENSRSAYRATPRAVSSVDSPAS